MQLLLWNFYNVSKVLYTTLRSCTSPAKKTALSRKCGLVAVCRNAFPEKFRRNSRNRGLVAIRGGGESAKTSRVFPSFPPARECAEFPRDRCTSGPSNKYIIRLQLHISCAISEISGIPGIPPRAGEFPEFRVSHFSRNWQNLNYRFTPQIVFRDFGGFRPFSVGTCIKLSLCNIWRTIGPFFPKNSVRNPGKKFPGKKTRFWGSKRRGYA